MRNRLLIYLCASAAPNLRRNNLPSIQFRGAAPRGNPTCKCKHRRRCSGGGGGVVQQQPQMLLALT